MAPLIALTGFMGSGKSSVGSEVAGILGVPFIDLDEEFVRSHDVGIPEFFATEGERAFRDEERKLLAAVLSQAKDSPGCVISLGGGTLQDAGSAALLAKRGGLVYLDVAGDVAWERVSGSGRPLATDLASFLARLAGRRPIYESFAQWVVPVGRTSVRELAEEIAGLAVDSGDRWKTSWGRLLRATDRGSLVIGGPGTLDVLGSRARSAVEEGRRFFVFTDRNVRESWGEEVLRLLRMEEGCALFVLEPGERSKNVETLGRCWEWLAERGARRDDIMVALGGGVVGDLAGFTAATYQRGLRLWQIPTSLLAQVDSSVGGKTAVNLVAGKNLVGAFYQPDLVVADPVVLKTLPEREYVSGLAEVIKHCLLISEEALADVERDVDQIASRDASVVTRLVKLSVNYKAGVVEEDEREAGRRSVLNLGHTVGHALEVTEGYGVLTHGEAVALGLIVALAVSERALGLDTSVRHRTRALLSAVGLPTVVDLPAGDLLLSAASRDKKKRAGSSGFVGLRQIGEPVWGMDVPESELMLALETIRR